MQASGLLLIVVGILVLFAAVTGKLDCFLIALKTCYEQGSNGEVAAKAEGSLKIPTATDSPLAIPSIPFNPNAKAADIFL